MQTLPTTLEPLKQWAESRQFSNDLEIMRLVDGWGVRKEIVNGSLRCEMWLGYGSVFNGDRQLTNAIQVSGFRQAGTVTEFDSKQIITRASLDNIKLIAFVLYGVVFKE